MTVTSSHEATAPRPPAEPAGGFVPREPGLATTARRWGRRASRTVGWATSDLRMLPGFLVIGAQRAGTTSLYRSLSEHPAVLPAVRHKGVHYFDVAYPRGLRWYRGHFPLRSAARRVQRRVGSPAMTGEASPYYMFHPAVPQRIAESLPDVRLLVLLRDPVERAYSAWKHEKSRGFETESFERAIDLEPQRLAGEAEKLLADPAYISLPHQHQAYLSRGCYSEQLRTLFEAVGRDRVLVLDFADYWSDPYAHFSRVLSFLGLPDWQPPAFKQDNARPRSPMSSSTRARLADFYAPYDQDLAQLLGETPSWRR